MSVGAWITLGFEPLKLLDWRTMLFLIDPYSYMDGHQLNGSKFERPLKWTIERFRTHFLNVKLNFNKSFCNSARYTFYFISQLHPSYFIEGNKNELMNDVTRFCLFWLVYFFLQLNLYFGIVYAKFNLIQPQQN